MEKLLVVNYRLYVSPALQMIFLLKTTLVLVDVVKQALPKITTICTVCDATNTISTYKVILTNC